ncbi:unnamed protein product, partial [marine sediment metagenome]
DKSSRPLNISQITAGVRAERGTASRRIVRERVNELVARDILQVIEDEDDANNLLNNSMIRMRIGCGFSAKKLMTS